jgi:hypothetical protein
VAVWLYVAFAQVAVFDVVGVGVGRADLAHHLDDVVDYLLAVDLVHRAR